jgi:dipeptide/tripeptide permease
MDPVFQALAEQYGLWVAFVLVVLGSFIATQVFPLIRDRLIPYLAEQQRLRHEREERVLKAFEENVRTNTELTHAIQDVSKQQQHMGTMLSGVAINVAVLLSKKRPGRDGQGVGGD